MNWIQFRTRLRIQAKAIEVKKEIENFKKRHYNTNQWTQAQIVAYCPQYYVC